MPIKENRTLWTIVMTDLEYSTAKSSKFRIAMIDLSTEQQTANVFTAQALFFFRVIGNHIRF